MSAPRRPHAEPWRPVELTESEVAAFKALQHGLANDGQQKLALSCIINHIAATFDQSFRPDSERATAFAEGRRYVGLRIVNALNTIVERASEPEKGAAHETPRRLRR